MKRLLSVLALLWLTTALMAQDAHLVMQFDFEKAAGMNVPDDISGVTAKVVSPAKVIEMGNRHVLDLGKGTGYLNMTINAGTVRVANTGKYAYGIRVNGKYTKGPNAVVQASIKEGESDNN